MDSSKKGLAFKVSRDFILSILAIVIYNGVLQLVIYPGLNARLGAEAFGTVLYFISAVSIMGAGFGTSASYGRIVAGKERNQSNGDYNIFLGIVALICILVSAVMVMVLGNGSETFASGSVAGTLSIFILMVITVIRYYCDVEYRMNIRFVDYCLFFLCVSIGYVAGLYLFDNWIFVILLGELCGIIYTFVRGSILRSPFLQRSEAFADNIKAAFYISVGNLLSAFVLHADRVILRLFTGAEEVTVFYTASLMGKIVALLTTPLNGIIISYLAGYKIRLDRRKFLLSSALLMLVSLVLSVVCTGASYVFVKIMYPDVFPMARDYFFLANLGQLLYFLSGTLMVVTLTFSEEKLQMIINGIYAAAFASIVLPLTIRLGISGMAWGLVIVNLFRFILTMILGLYQLSQERASSEG